MNSNRSGRIFDIKRYAIHDGPGIRTTVFMKGCPLSCQWCHNPEGLFVAPPIAYEKKRCIGCGACVDGCPQKALILTSSGVATDAARCTGGGTCVDLCPAGARERTTIAIGVDRLMAEIQKDVIFYDASGGGVTFSGGEPLLQPDFLTEMLTVCGDVGIHRAVDTAGYAQRAVLERVARHTDLFLYDLKLMDPERHRRYTGVSNRRILDNLRWLSRQGAVVDIRIPLLPGVNDDDDNLQQVIDFLTTLPRIGGVHLLPYHDFQKNKYAKLGLPYHAENVSAPENARLAALVKRFKDSGLPAGLGG